MHEDIRVARTRAPHTKMKSHKVLSESSTSVAARCILALIVFVASSTQHANSQAANNRVARRILPPPPQSLADSDSAPDPMEPCYLANNRASESLTISESTPVGTVVGELMVNGDSSTNGNIELSIRMPSGTLQQQQQQQQLSPTRRETATLGRRSAPAQTPSLKSARDLSNLIELMPPLSIERDTKRLILAKKLDRENIDRYIAAGAAYSVPDSSSGGASGSLTVHVKCTLKTRALETTTTTTVQSAVANSTSAPPQQQQQRQQISAAQGSIVIPIHLIVMDDNDNWPVFVGAPYVLELNESAHAGTALSANEILAIDNDQQGPLSTIEYTIVPGNYFSDSFGFLNPLDARSLVVKDARLLDYEAVPKLALKVMARDQGEPSNWAVAALHVHLLDRDDLNPAFADDKYVAYVKDNRPHEHIDTLPRRMFARDADKQVQAPVAYAFHTKTEHSIHFDLDPDTGKLELRKSFDVDTEPASFCLLVRATQVDNALRWTLTAINVRLAVAAQANSQQQQPQQTTDPNFGFADSNITVQVSESAPLGFTVLMLHAHVAANTTTTTMRFQLLDNELGLFALDERTGRLSLNKSLDYELYRRVSVRVLVTRDTANANAGTGQLPRLQCDITRVNVLVVPQNEFNPEFSHEQYNFQLSVSDLVAAFDSSSSLHEESDGLMRKRLGEINALESTTTPDELGVATPAVAAAAAATRALQLGQVHCADRDAGEHVSLRLTGSKASLFRLLPDGRLYMPLVNASGDASSAIEAPSDNAATAAKPVVFAARRRNDQDAAAMAAAAAAASTAQSNSQQLDTKYLNYLLAEISNLGRFRLKVVASDDGQPKARQSVALIVITIISIDNFIIQRQPSLTYVAPTDATSSASAINDTSYKQTSRATDVEQQQQQQTPSHLMMIPAANGRSYVHINPDIIGNLISKAARGVDSSSSSNKSALISSNVAPSSVAASADKQPPGLLLVDDDGAKFVAMPAAIEVYNQQVQEAAELQGARQRSLSHAYMVDAPARSTSYMSASPSFSAANSASLWQRWTSKLGLAESPADERAAAGHLHWLQVSTAIALHLIAVAIIVALVSRVSSAIRSSRCASSRLATTNGGGGSGSAGSGGGWSASWASIWARRNARQHTSVINILDSQNLRSSSSSSSTTSVMSTSATPHEFAQHRPNFGLMSTRPPATKLGADLGTPGAFFASGDACASGRPAMGAGDPLVDSRQQKLFMHLKQTLNNMLNNSANQTKQQSVVTVRALDADSTDRFAADDVAAATVATVDSSSNNSNNKLKVGGDASNKSSTFVGAQADKSDSRAGQPTSVNAAGVRKPRNASTVALALGASHSPASSAVSLESIAMMSASSSISSSISEKINAAADGSSLDSATLFNGLPIGGPRRGKQAAPAPPVVPANTPPTPPPLPPPPPPSVVQFAAGALECPKTATESRADKQPAAEQQTTSSSSSSGSSGIQSQNRRPLPQNPAHVRVRQQAASVSAEQRQQAADKKASASAKGAQQKTTTSPTTSVDRGYESCHSSGGSSGRQRALQQPQQQQQQQQQSAASQRRVMAPTVASVNRQAALKQAPRAVAASGRRAALAVPQQRASDALRRPTLAPTGRRRAPAELGGAVRAQPQRHNLVSRAHHSSGVARSLATKQVGNNAAPDSASGSGSAAASASQQDDEDFFYCYNENDDVARAANLARDYASHMYQPANEETAAAAAKTVDAVANTLAMYAAAAAQQPPLPPPPTTTKMPLRGRANARAHTNTHAPAMQHLYAANNRAHSSNNHQMLLARSPGLHIVGQHGYIVGPGKKQLTWSDQVGIL